MRFLIVAHFDDLTALQIGAILRARHGPEQVRLVSGEELLLAPHWTHSLGSSCAATTLTLADGTSVSSSDVGVVLNRLRYVLTHYWETAKAADREYALMETYALWLSWLASLPCPVVNPVTTRGLGLQQRSHAEWLVLAGRAGLPVRGYAATSAPRLYAKEGYVPHNRVQGVDTSPYAQYQRLSAPIPGHLPVVFLEPLAEERTDVFLIGDRCIDEQEQEKYMAVSRLASLAGCDLLQVSVAHTTSGNQADSARSTWSICDVSSFLQTNRPDVLAAVADYLEQREQAYKNRL